MAKFFGAFGAGVVTAGFFLSAPIQRPAVLQHAPDFRQQNASQDAGWVLVPPTMPFAQPLMACPQTSAGFEQQQHPRLATPLPDNSQAATTGSSAGAAHGTATIPEPNEQSAASRGAEPSCNYSVCRRYYRSFDETTCTYQPHRGPRELCTR
jgi:hypothetical protein